MADGKVDFELVSPARLLTSKPVDMVVVPGDEGDFGVLPGHAPLLSTVRPGVILVYEGREVSERIFVAGGFAEVTRERCTVLAELAMPVSEIDSAQTERDLHTAREDVDLASTDHEREIAVRRVDVAQAMLDAIRRGPAH
jgi:F-type H+-transporting ATPase subunit epsilon